MYSYREIIINKLKKKIIIVSGENQTGKTWVAKLITSMKLSNTLMIDQFFEDLITLYKFKNIKFETLKKLIHNYLNYYLINRCMGRNYNFKPQEESSIYNLSQYKFKKAIKNIFQKNSKKKLIDNLKSNNEIIIVVHDLLDKIDILYKIFSEIKIINVIHHPVDQITSIYEKHKNFGDNKNDILNNTLKYKFKNQKFSTLAFGNEKNFNKKKLICKILYSKKETEARYKKNSKNIKKKNNLLQIKYEDLFKKDKIALKKISFFLKKKFSKQSYNILRSEEFKNRKKKLKRRNFFEAKLKKILKVNELKILNNMKKNYENISK